MNGPISNYTPTFNPLFENIDWGYLKNTFPGSFEMLNRFLETPIIFSKLPGVLNLYYEQVDLQTSTMNSRITTSEILP